MINREWQQVSVITYNSTLDSYGQKRKSGSSTRSVEMVIKISSQSNVDDPRYVDVTDIGITRDTNITTGNQILVGTTYYDVLYVIPSSRYYQVLMKRV